MQELRSLMINGAMISTHSRRSRAPANTIKRDRQRRAITLLLLCADQNNKLAAEEMEKRITCNQPRRRAEKRNGSQTINKLEGDRRNNKPKYVSQSVDDRLLLLLHQALAVGAFEGGMEEGSTAKNHSQRHSHNVFTNNWPDEKMKIKMNDWPTSVGGSHMEVGPQAAAPPPHDDGQQTRCTPPGSGQARVEEHERKREYYEERYQWIVMAINSRTRTGHNDPQLHNDHFWTVYCNNCYLILFACNSSSSFFSTFVGVNLVALEITLAGVLFLALMCHYNFL